MESFSTLGEGRRELTSVKDTLKSVSPSDCLASPGSSVRANVGSKQLFSFVNSTALPTVSQFSIIFYIVEISPGCVFAD